MDVINRLAQRFGTGAEVALGAAMAVVIALNALVTVKSDRGWPFGLGVGVAICAVALLRGRNRARAAATGLVLFAAAGLAVALRAISLGPLFGGGLVGLLVLGAAAVRTLPPRRAALIGAAGTLVIAANETAGPYGLFDHRVLWALAGATLWAAALAIGLYLRYLDFLHRQMLEKARRQERLEARVPAAGAGNRLSERELDIARSIARGRTNLEIAAELFISLSTVKTHITRIQHKLGVRNRVEIAAWSWENRIMNE
jgi:DNA-binding CsgD family transcriptional regulator